MAAIDLDEAGRGRALLRNHNPRMRFPITPSILMPRGVGQFAALTSLSVLALAGTLHAQDFEGKNISEVEIRYNGPKTADEARLRNLMTSKAGAQYRSENLDTDIKSLYESGLVDDVRFLAEPVGGSVKLIAEVTTRPFLDGVGFVGNTIFTDQKLAKETKLKAGGTLSDEQILEARRNIEITGRSDDMLIIRGVNVFPSQIEELILRQPKLSPHYVLEVSRDGHLDAMTVNVELKPEQQFASGPEKEFVARDLQHHIKSYIGISAKISIVEVGGIERSIGKAKRVIDKRPK